MKTKTLHKALSMLLTAAMVFNMGLTPVFAEGVAIGASGLTKCHTEHDSECGYSETIQMGGCTHAHDGDCGFTEVTAEQPCTFKAEEDAEASPADAVEHEHNEACGYAPATEGTPCTHEHDDVCGYGETVTATPCTHTCEVCKVVDSGNPAEKVCICEPALGASDVGHGEDCPLYTAPECTCGAVDSGELVHGEGCPLYAPPELSEAVTALIAMVDALPNAADITAENREATKPAYEAAAMAYEALSDEDKAAFEQTSQYTKLMALRDLLFGIAQMAESTWNIGTQGDLTLTDDGTCGGHIVTGTTTTNKIIVQSGTHNITLDNANIDVSATDKTRAFQITNGATVNLTLTGSSTLESGSDRAGLQASTGATLVITAASTGSLSATGGYGGAGIGGGSNDGGGTITIAGGTVTATSGDGGAGIGGGSTGAGGTININGGTVTATGSNGGAGIGGGSRGAGGEITITDNAVVFAIIGRGASNHIGAGLGGAAGTVNRSGGMIFEGTDGLLYGTSVTPTAGFTIPATHTLTIKMGETLTINNVIIVTNNGTILNSGTISGAIAENQPVIPNAKTHSIDTGSLFLDSSCGGGGGTCAGHAVSGETTAYKIVAKSGTHNVTLNDVSIQFSDGSDPTPGTCAFEIQSGAAINLTLTGNNTLKSGNLKAGLQASAGATLVITAASTGSLSATGGYMSAGIGGGYSRGGGTITIAGGTVTATGGTSGAGIGGGNNGSGGTITIGGGTVIATGGMNGAGIGGGYSRSGGTITMSGNAVVFATKGSRAPNHIGAGASGTGGTVNRDGGMIFEGDSGKVHGCTLEKDFTLSADQTLEIVTDKTLTIPSDKTLTNYGKITTNGTIDNNGTFTSTGTIDGTGSYTGNGTVTLTKSIIKPPASLAYTGAAKAVTVELLSYKFAENTDYTVEYNPSDNINVGAVIPTVTPKSSSRLTGSAVVGDPFTISQSGTEFTGGVTVDKADKTYTYGDEITVKVTPAATGTAPVVKGRAFTPPITNQMALFKGDVQLTAPQTATSGNELTFTIDTTGKQLDIDKNTITAKYVGNNNMAGHIGTVEVTLNKKPLTATVTAGTTKVYDGNASFTNVALTLGSDEVLAGDTVNVTADGTADNANAGAGKTFTATSVNGLDTGDGAYYSLANDAISGNVTVAQREATLSWSNTELTYNAAAQAPAVTITNKVGGDDVAVTVTGSQTNAGSGYTATASSLTGTDMANYKLPAVTIMAFNIQAADPAGSVVISTNDANSNEKLDNGDTVTADISGITPAGGTVSYQWKKITDSTTSNIGSDQATYTLNANDIKGKIFCEVIFRGNVVGTKESNKLDIAKALLKGTIVITGDTSLGSTLTVTTPTNATSADYTVKWHRDNVEIQGASASGYTLTKFDLGKTIKVVITAKEASEGFTGTLTSNNVSVPATAPEKPTITAAAGNGFVTVKGITAFDNGSAITGYTLTVKQGDTHIAGSPFTIGLSTTEYKVENLTNGATYSFMLTATNAKGSTDSDVINATPKGTSSGNGGGGSTGGSGNGNNSDNSSQINPPTAESKPENGNVNLNPSVDKDGNATVSVGDKDIEKAIKEAEKQAKKNGTEKNGIAVTITIDTNKTLNSFTANLPKSTQEKLIAAGVTSLTINGGVKLTFDLEAIKQIKTTANTDVVVTATKTANSALSQEAQAATGGRPVYDFKVTGGGKNITTFGSGKLSLSIPYELQKVDGNGKPSATGSFENPGNLVGVYIDGAGKLTYLPGSSYNAARKTMLISTTHLSVYGVAYKTNAPTFTDTASHWAKDDIQFVAARGLLTGTTATTFSPNTSMTRGMFVTALGRLAGIDTNSYKTGSFTDVKTDAYYAPYVNWAVQNNIVTGTSTTTFAPDSAITRQEMAVMTANYAKAIGYKLPSVHKEIIFTDSASIGTWAKDAVKEMQMAGILQGRDGGKFDPTGTATRAEVSAMLRRFVELVANSETAEGWVTNDSGNWMYFENGKAVTGKKKIDGTTYEFDQYGVTAILPKDRRFTLYTVQKGDSFWAIASKYKVNIFELVSLNGKNIFSTIHPGDELKIPQK